MYKIHSLLINNFFTGDGYYRDCIDGILNFLPNLDIKCACYKSVITAYSSYLNVL